MGADQQKAKRVKDLTPYQINEQVIDPCQRPRHLHALPPGYRGEEMTDEVIEGRTRQFGTRAKTECTPEKAVLALLMGCLGDREGAKR